MSTGAAPLGVSDLDWVPANSAHVIEFFNTWVPAHVARQAMKDAKYTYRLFPWHQIISVFPTLVAVSAGGNVEGMIGIGKLSGAAVKVEYVATAPWNFGASQRRKGVGPALIGLAIELSKLWGAGGALTLSSTPESASFYSGTGFVHSGQLDKGLKVFDLSPQAAAAFLTRYRGFRNSSSQAPSNPVGVPVVAKPAAGRAPARPLSPPPVPTDLGSNPDDLDGDDTDEPEAN